MAKLRRACRRHSGPPKSSPGDSATCAWSTRRPATPSTPGPSSAGNRNQTLETIAERYPGEPGQVRDEVPFSSEYKWSGVSLDGNGAGGGTFVLGAPDVLIGSGSLVLSPGMAATLEEETAAGRRVVAFGRSGEELPGDPAAAPAPRSTRTSSSP